jgi:hypothetical protein
VTRFAYPPKTKEEKKRAKQIQDIFATHADWDRVVVWASPDDERVFDTQSLDVLSKKIGDLKALIDYGEMDAIALLAWSIFEAQARMIVQGASEQRIAGDSLLEAMAATGRITPDEADSLRVFKRKRDRVSHGDFATKFEAPELITTTKIMLRLWNDVLKEFENQGGQSVV